MLLRILRTRLAPYQRPLTAGRRCCSSSAPSPRCTCPASTPTSSTTASRRATPATSRAPARLCWRSRWCRSCARSAPSTSARGPRWRSAATSARRSSTGSARSRAREVHQFGAPSLITRNTNDVQQVQMLVLMTLHDDGRRADHDGRRHPAWRCARTSASRGCSSVSVPVLFLVRRLHRSRRMVPGFRLMQKRIDGVNRSCASRSPASAWCARSCASRSRPERFGRRQRRPHRRRGHDRPLDGDDVPRRDADPQRLQRRRAVVRRPPRRRRRRCRSAR